MTNEQIERFQRETEKAGLITDDFIEMAMIMLAIIYEATDEQLEHLDYQSKEPAIKHLRMLSEVLGIDEAVVVSEKEEGDIKTPLEQLNQLLASTYSKTMVEDSQTESQEAMEESAEVQTSDSTEDSIEENSKIPYEAVNQYMIHSDYLSATQMLVLTEAMGAKMPEEKILEMAEANKPAQEMRRCIEFWLAMHGEGQEKVDEEKEFLQNQLAKVKGNQKRTWIILIVTEIVSVIIAFIIGSLFL